MGGAPSQHQTTTIEIVQHIDSITTQSPDHLTINTSQVKHHSLPASISNFEAEIVRGHNGQSSNSKHEEVSKKWQGFTMRNFDNHVPLRRNSNLSRPLSCHEICISLDFSITPTNPPPAHLSPRTISESA